MPANGKKKLYHRRVSPIVRKGGRSNDTHMPKMNEKNTSKPAIVAAYATFDLSFQAAQAPITQKITAPNANHIKLLHVIF
jgi:hypothetical protein